MRDFGREIVWIDSLLCDERRFSRREGRVHREGIHGTLSDKEGRKEERIVWVMEIIGEGVLSMEGILRD